MQDRMGIEDAGSDRGELTGSAPLDAEFRIKPAVISRSMTSAQVAGILARSEQLRVSRVVTREQALQIALDHLTDGLCHRLSVSAGWPTEAPYGYQHHQRQDQHALQDLPAALRNPDADRGETPEPPTTAPAAAPEEPPRPVWRVRVPSERLAVGASRFIVIDQETGEVIADGRYGE